MVRPHSCERSTPQVTPQGDDLDLEVLIGDLLGRDLILKGTYSVLEVRYVALQPRQPLGLGLTSGRAARGRAAGRPAILGINHAGQHHERDQGTDKTHPVHLLPLHRHGSKSVAQAHVPDASKLTEKSSVITIG
jgi:hypothetical protein